MIASSLITFIKRNQSDTISAHHSELEMKRTIYSRYLDWNLDTIVKIANPDEIEAGRTRRFYVRGIAKLGEDARRELYVLHAEQVFVTEEFDDENLADQYHQEAKAELQLMIDQLKVPAKM